MKKITGGFTLVEILVVVLILVFLTVGIYGVLNMGEKTFFTDMGLIDLQQQVRQSIDGMVKELRQNASDITISNGGAKVVFKIPTQIGPTVLSGDISYELVNGQIIRQYSGVDSILANDINTLNFCCWHDAVCDAVCSSADFLEIQLSANKTVNRREVVFPSNGTITEKVRLRN